jgi:hypothetical protein
VSLTVTTRTIPAVSSLPLDSTSNSSDSSDNTTETPHEEENLYRNGSVDKREKEKNTGQERGRERERGEGRGEGTETTRERKTEESQETKRKRIFSYLFLLAPETWSNEDLSRWLTSKNISIGTKGVSAKDLFQANEKQLLSLIPQLGMRKRFLTAMEEAMRRYAEANTQQETSRSPGQSTVQSFHVRKISADGKESLSTIELEQKKGAKLKLRQIEVALQTKFDNSSLIIEGFEFVVPGKALGTPVTLLRSKQLRDAVGIAQRTGINLVVIVK